MRFSSAAFALLPTLALAETILVRVGDGGLKFTPDQVTARVDDIITFEFVAKNHTVSQSLFATPCTLAIDAATGQKGVDSGFVPVPPGTTPLPRYSIKIKNADAPLWFYCAQGNHCQQGMVFSVNPTADKTHEQFVANARAFVPGAPPAAPPPGSTPSSSVPGAVTPTNTAGIPNSSGGFAPPTGPTGGNPNGPPGSLPTALPPPGGAVEPVNDPNTDPQNANGGGNGSNGASRTSGSAAVLTFAALVAGVLLI